MPTLALVRDLMFASKISATARAAGVEVKIIRDPAQLPDEGDRLFFDMEPPGAIEAALAWKAKTGGETIGFAGHVYAGTFKRAKEAGIDQTFTRGQFDANLTQLLNA